MYSSGGESLLCFDKKITTKRKKTCPRERRAHESARSSAILTGGLAAIGTRKLGFFILDQRPAILIDRHQVVVGLLDQLGGILHLDSGLRFLNQRLRLRLAFLRVRLLSAGFRVTGMLLLVQRHHRVPHERVSAVRSRAVEVPIDAIAVAAVQPAVDHLVVEREARRDVDVVVEVLAVHEQLVRSVGGEVASRLRAMMMPG